MQDNMVPSLSVMRQQISAISQKKITSVVEWNGAITAGVAPGIVWALMPAGKTTFLHQTTGTLTGDATKIYDFNGCSVVRLFSSIQVAGAAANTLIGIDYSLDNSSWSTLLQLTITNLIGAKDSGWTAIPSGARNSFCYLRLYGQNGNGIASPQLSPPTLLIR